MAQIKINKLTFAYDGRGENVFDNVSFSFDSNWKIGLIGRNGRGNNFYPKIYRFWNGFMGKEGKTEKRKG